MRTSAFLFPALLLFAACGSMQETTQVRDDVYDIPDRSVVASIEAVPQAEPEPAKPNDDYYNPSEAKQYEQGTYWDRTYNEPQWYNQSRFGFGYGVNSWGGSGWNMSYNQGFGNGFGGMYDPYWSNSWQSGYGAWGNPYGYYSPWNNGFYDPWGWNNPYAYNYGACIGCVPSWFHNQCGGFGYGNGGFNGNSWLDGTGTTHIISHRPSMTGGGAVAGGGGTGTPRGSRTRDLGPQRPADHLRVLRPELDRGTTPVRPDRNDAREKPAREERKERPDRKRDRDTEPKFERERTPRLDTGNSGGGRGNGGGSTPAPSPSPRPRR
ncbi:MAG: hypothetical protein IPO90_01530 [Flavobacteriales bacterium]|nr:hypothetical protein [Flavobacteriales bacterium]